MSQKTLISNHGLRTPKEAPELLGLGRQISHWSIWGIFGRTISTHFGAVYPSPLSTFSITQPLFLQKTKPLYPHHDWGLGFTQGIRNLAFVCPIV